MQKTDLKDGAVRFVLNDFLGIYKKYKLDTALGFLLPAVGSVCIFFVPPLIIGDIVDGFVISGSISFNTAFLDVLLLTSIWLLGEAFWRLGMVYQLRLYKNGIGDLSKRSFKLLSTRDSEFFANNFSGSLTKKAMTYSRNFDHFTSILNFEVFNNLFPMIFAMIVLARYSIYIPLVLVVFIGIAVFIIVPLIKMRMKFVVERHDAGSKMSGRISDSISNMMAVKSFAREKEENKYYENVVDNFISAMHKADVFQNTRIDALLSPLYVFTNTIGLLAGIYFADKLGLLPGAVVVIFSYFSQLTRSFWSINHVYRGIEGNVTEAAEFAELVLDEAEVVDQEGAREISMRDGGLEFRDVNFSYNDSSNKKRKAFLRNFNLVISDGERVGLVGPSGGGKSTITKLILRFKDVTSGKILVGGEDVREVTQESLRRSISYVPQEPMLFHRSIYENILYGDTSKSKEDVIQAAKLAHAHDFIVKLKEGYDTVVGERGVKLSGGQRQRIAIARAILKHTKILVLDEATSALDSESEKMIQAGLSELMKGKTALVIAHRLSTIKNMDRILVLENGTITEDGTHDQLVKKGGTYARLWSHQTGDYIE